MPYCSPQKVQFTSYYRDLLFQQIEQWCKAPIKRKHVRESDPYDWEKGEIFNLLIETSTIMSTFILFDHSPIFCFDINSRAHFCFSCDPFSSFL